MVEEKVLYEHQYKVNLMITAAWKLNVYQIPYPGAYLKSLRLIAIQETLAMIQIQINYCDQVMLNPIQDQLQLTQL